MTTAVQTEERKVRKRSEVEQETMIERNRDELPENLRGRLKCPMCQRVVEVQTKEQYETLKIHIRNRSHGSPANIINLDLEAKA